MYHNIDTIENEYDIKVIIVDQINHDQFNFMDEIVNINDTQFQLRTIVGTRTLGHNFEWYGYIYSRHGDSYNVWCFDDKDIYIPIQLDNLSDILPYNDKYTCVYVCVNNADTMILGNNFLQSLGGQSHVRCLTHKLPLIASSTR